MDFPVARPIKLCHSRRGNVVNRGAKGRGLEDHRVCESQKRESHGGEQVSPLRLVKELSLICKGAPIKNWNFPGGQNGERYRSTGNTIKKKGSHRIRAALEAPSGGKGSKSVLEYCFVRAQYSQPVIS